MNRTSLPLLLCAVMLVVSACAPSKGEVSTTPEDRTSLFSDLYADAKEVQASDEQLAALEAATTSREIPLETAREAARRAVSCMQQAGVVAAYEEQEGSHGTVIPSWTAQEGEAEEFSAQIEACDEREFLFVSQGYQLQASSIEAMEQYVEQQAPVIRACLEENGHDVDADADGPDLADQASRVYTDTAGAVDCLGEAGVSAW